MKVAKVRNTDYYIFETYDEFKQHFKGSPPEIVADWRDSKTGDWVYSDDNCIIQIIKAGGNANNSRNSANRNHRPSYVRTAIGTFPTGYRSFMDTDITRKRNRYTFSGKAYNHEDRQYGNRKYLSRTEKQFMLNILGQMLRGDPIDPIDAWMKASTCNLNTARLRSEILMNNKKFVRDLMMIGKQICEQNGLTDEYLIKQHKSILEDRDIDPKVRLEAIKEAYKLRDDYPDPAPTGPKRFLGYYEETRHLPTGKIDPDAVTLLEDVDFSQITSNTNDDE